MNYVTEGPVIVFPEPSNPNCFTPPFQHHFGTQIMPPEAAIDNWNENPYLMHSENWYTFNKLKKQRMVKANERYLKLPDVPVVQLPSKRRLPQPAFKPMFDSLTDLRLRLCGGAIFIGSELYYVGEAYELENDYLLVVRDAEGKDYKAFYRDTPAIDLRSPEPQYITFQNQPAYLIRPPYKQQRQALNHENTHVRVVNSGRSQNIDPRDVMRGLSRESLMWSPQLEELVGKVKVLQAVRLSKDIAFYFSGKKIKAEYKGRLLGQVRDDTITVDDTDYGRPWIKRDVSIIGCTMRLN